MERNRRRPRRSGARASLALAVLCAAPGCGSREHTLGREVLGPIVARGAVPFDPGSVPGAMIADLAGARVVVLGETHYVQEHQDLLVLLLPHLHAAGIRSVAQEQMHAVAWAGEEYAALRSDVLPIEVAAFDRTLLEGLRAFNAGRSEAERIHFVGLDMNHWRGVFPEYLRLFESRFGVVPQLAPLLGAVPDSAEYAAALQALPAALAADAPTIAATIGADRLAQLVELVDVELRSLPLRASRDDAGRELLLRDRIVATLAGAGDAGVAVNCGMFHAQRRRELPGPPVEPVGAWLAAHPEAYGGDPSALRSVVFLGARGETKDHYDDATARSFDAVRDASRNDLVRILAEHAGARAAWMPLSDPLLTTELVEIDVSGRTLAVHAGALFDGLVVYPEVTVLASLALL